MSNPLDVETWADVVIAFDDGTRATVTVHDTGLGETRAGWNRPSCDDDRFRAVAAAWRAPARGRVAASDAG